MAKVSFIEITQSQLNELPFVDGRIVYCKDTENAYKDLENERKPISRDVIKVDDLPIAPLADKLYIWGTEIYMYVNGYWELLNPSAEEQSLTFTEASSRANISSGEKIGTILGKLKRWFSDLKSVAWTGSYDDLADTPTSMTPTSHASSAVTYGKGDGSNYLQIMLVF